MITLCSTSPSVISAAVTTSICAVISVQHQLLPTWSKVPQAGADLSAARCGSQPDAEMVGDGEDILVAAAAHIHDDQVVARQARCDFGDMAESMGRLERRDDAFEPAR